MSVLKYFKTTPRSPYGGATGPKCNFFSSNLQRGSWQKKTRGPVAPPTGDRGLSPTPGATGPCRPPEGRLPPSAALTHAGGQMSACRWSDHACRWRFECHGSWVSRFPKKRFECSSVRFECHGSQKKRFECQACNSVRFECSGSGSRMQLSEVWVSGLGNCAHP